MLFNEIVLDIDEYQTNIIVGKNNYRYFKVLDCFSIYKVVDGFENISLILKELQLKLKHGKIRAKNINILLPSNFFYLEDFTIPFSDEATVKDIVETRLRILKSQESNYSYQYEVSEVDMTNMQVFGYIIGLSQYRIDHLKRELYKMKLKPKVLGMKNSSVNDFLKDSLINKHYNTAYLNYLILDIKSDKVDLTFSQSGNLALIQQYDISFVDYYKKYKSDLDFHTIIENICRGEYSISMEKENFISKFLDPITSLVSLSSDYFESKFKSSIQLLILTGNFSKIEGIKNFFTLKTGIHSIELESIDDLKIREDIEKEYFLSLSGFPNIKRW